MNTYDIVKQLPPWVNEAWLRAAVQPRVEPTPSEECEHGIVGRCPYCMRDNA
jgi:hypothetical protein